MPKTKHTSESLFVQRSSHSDSTGGFDWAIVNNQQDIIAECYEHVNYSKNRKVSFKTMPARSNALIFAAASDLLAACIKVIETHSPELDEDMRIQIIAAINKAEGASK